MSHGLERIQWKAPTERDGDSVANPQPSAVSAHDALVEKCRALAAKWTNRANSIYAMFPGDQAAERIEFCRDELLRALGDGR